MNLDYSAYEGTKIAGRVELVMARGSVVIDGGRYVGRAGHGRYLERGLSQCLA